MHRSAVRTVPFTFSVTFSPTVLTALVAVLGALLVASPPHADASGRASSAPDESWTVSSRHIAVRRAGGTVREQITVSLPSPAVVDVGIRDLHGSRVRGRVRLGMLSAGVHRWTWDGRRNDGTRAAEGRYRVNVRARFKGSGTRLGHDTDAWVNRFYTPGPLTTEHRILYPRSTIVHDRTLLDERAPEPVRATMRIRDESGDVVFRRTFTRFRTHLSLGWDGRTRTGEVLPAGTYQVRVSGTDRDGLTGRTGARTVRIARARLVERTRTVTVAPASSTTDLYPVGCNGCGDFPPCGTVRASVRFAEQGALTLDSGPGCGDRVGIWESVSAHRLLLHDDAPRGYGSATVAVFGGPTTPGGSDQAELSAAYGLTCDDDGGCSGGGGTATLTGPDPTDHTTTSPPVPITLVELSSLDLVPGIAWSVGTRDGASYDVASFTVTYDFLTPEP